MKTTRSFKLAQDLVNDGMVPPKNLRLVQAKISGILFGCPDYTDEEIGFLLATDPCFDVIFS